MKVTLQGGVLTVTAENPKEQRYLEQKLLPALKPLESGKGPTPLSDPVDPPHPPPHNPPHSSSSSSSRP